MLTCMLRVSPPTAIRPTLTGFAEAGSTLAMETSVGSYVKICCPDGAGMRLWAVAGDWTLAATVPLPLADAAVSGSVIVTVSMRLADILPAASFTHA